MIFEILAFTAALYCLCATSVNSSDIIARVPPTEGNWHPIKTLFAELNWKYVTMQLCVYLLTCGDQNHGCYQPGRILSLSVYSFL